MKTIILLLFISFHITGYSQRYLLLPYYNVDSIQQILTDQSGEERINSLNRLAVSLFYEKTDLSAEYVEEAMNLARELDYEEGMADAYRNRGYIYRYQGNFAKAMNSYLEALELYKKFDNKHTAGWVYFDIARTHYVAANYEKSIEYCNKALDVFRERQEGGATLGDVNDTIMMYGALGLVYRINGDYTKALKTNLMVHEIMELNHYDILELVLTSWTTGFDFITLNKFDSAKIFFQKALSYPDDNLNIRAIKLRAVEGLGILFTRAGEMDSAFFYLQKAYEWYNKNGFLYMASNTAFQSGYYYYKSNETENARKYLQQAESIFNEMLAKNSWYSHDSLRNIVTFGSELYYPIPPVQMKRMMWETGVRIYYLLFKISEANKRTEEALKYHIAYAVANDTLNELYENKEIIELQARFESSQKENQIELLARENELRAYKLNQSRLFIFGLIGLVILVIILAVILIRMNKLRERENNLLLQQKLFRSQMNPHFLFNSLVSIQNFILNQEPAKAGKYLSKFSKLVRNILDSSFEEYVPIEEEISIIENYLDLQKVRFSDQFEYSIEVDESIDTENIKIPPMMAQPIIENALEHGIKHKKNSGKIHVRFKRNNGYLIFEVEDDGIGRKRAMELLQKQDKGHKSLTTTITRERVRVLNKRLRKKISMRVEDLVDSRNEPSGTRVTFEIPVVF